MFAIPNLDRIFYNGSLRCRDVVWPKVKGNGNGLCQIYISGLEVKAINRILYSGVEFDSLLARQRLRTIYSSFFSEQR